MGDLVRATGVQPGSLYGAFEGGKRQLFIEALKLYLMVNTTVELAAEDSEVSGLTRDHMTRLERNVERALRNARRGGEIPAAIDPAVKATQLMATEMGLMVVGKTNPGREVLETIVNAAFADLG